MKKWILLTMVSLSAADVDSHFVLDVELSAENHEEIVHDHFSLPKQRLVIPVLEGDDAEDPALTHVTRKSRMFSLQAQETSIDMQDLQRVVDFMHKIHNVQTRQEIKTNSIQKKIGGVIGGILVLASLVQAGLLVYNSYASSK